MGRSGVDNYFDFNNRIIHYYYFNQDDKDMNRRKNLDAIHALHKSLDYWWSKYVNDNTNEFQMMYMLKYNFVWSESF